MKKKNPKKRAITSFILVSIMIVIGLVLSFGQFTIPFTCYRYNGFMNSIKLGIDLKGGVLAVYDVSQNEDASGDFDTQVQATIDRLSTLLAENGFPEATVVKEGEGVSGTKIRVEVPDIDNPDEVLELVGRPAKLEFKKEDTKEAPAILSGKHIKEVFASYQEGQYGVSIEFNAEGAKLFHDLTSELQPNNGSLYIYLDGNKFSAPTVQSVIADGKTFISGSMDTQAAAEAYATKILSGTFSVNLELESSENVSASLGANALKYGLIAGALAILFIFIFMGVIYRGLGLMANLALTLYAILLLFLLQAIPLVQLTLPGIAGIILSFGMAVDANVVIFERMKEEYRSGKKLSASAQSGFKRATRAILDGNITTILAGTVLLLFGTGAIKGFAITLLLGVVVSMFTALTVTQWLVKSCVALRGEEKDSKFYGFKREVVTNE